MGPNATLLLLLLHATLLLLSVPVRSDFSIPYLLQGINNFRISSGASAVVKHYKAQCLSDEIVDKLEHQGCETAPKQSQLPTDYPDALSKCKINPNAARDGMVLPVCLPHPPPSLVLANYTLSQNSKYVKDSKFTGAGLAEEDDWTVLVLITSTPGGDFASTAFRLASTCYAVSSMLVLAVTVFLLT